MTKRIPGWVVYVPHLNAAYPIAYWVRDSVAVTITDDYGNTRTETYKVDDVHLFKQPEASEFDMRGLAVSVLLEQGKLEKSPLYLHAQDSRRRINRFMADTIKQLKGLEGHARSGAHTYAKIVLRERIVSEQKLIESLANLNHQFKPDEVRHLVRVYKQATRQYAKLDEILGGA